MSGYLSTLTLKTCRLTASDSTWALCDDCGGTLWSTRIGTKEAGILTTLLAPISLAARYCLCRARTRPRAEVAPATSARSGDEGVLTASYA